MKSYLKFFVFLGFITQYSCSPKVEDNVRVLIKGQVVDQNGSAIPNAQIKVFSQNEIYYASPESYYLLGEGYSKLDGTFSVASFLVIDDDFSIFVRNGHNYSEYSYQSNTLNYLPDNLTFDLGVVSIGELANVSVNINRASPQGTTLSYNIIYPSAYCREYYNEGILDEIQSYCFEENYTYGSLNDDNSDDSRSFQTLLGATVEFTYSINGQPEETQLLTIDQEDYEFNFAY